MTAHNVMPMPIPIRRPSAAEGVIVLDLDLQPVALDAGGQMIVQMLNGDETESDAPKLPAVVHRLLAGKSPDDLIGSRLRLETAEAHYSCRVFWMLPQSSLQTGPLLAIHLRQEPSVGDAVRRVARTYHLTEREEEAVVGIAMGLTS